MGRSCSARVEAVTTSRLGCCPRRRRRAETADGDGGASGLLREAETAVGDGDASGSVGQGRDGSASSLPARRGLGAFSQLHTAKAPEVAATDSLPRTELRILFRFSRLSSENRIKNSV